MNKPIDLILDTDTYNEIDDQYALAYALLSPEQLNLKGVYAAPFHNEKSEGPEDGMLKSFDEIMNILSLMDKKNLSGIVKHGSRGYLADEASPQTSEAAGHLIALARNYTADNPLHVVAIGAITNIASALLLDPSIKERIVVVWLGGHALHWPDCKEFNLIQDVAAARVVFSSGVRLIQLPCMGVVSELRVTGPELDHHLLGKNKLCDYLVKVTTEEGQNGSPYQTWSRVLWDVSAVACLLHPSYCPSRRIPAPIPSYDGHYTIDPTRHLIRSVYHVDRDAILNDLFTKLSQG